MIKKDVLSRTADSYPPQRGSGGTDPAHRSAANTGSRTLETTTHLRLDAGSQKRSSSVSGGPHLDFSRAAKDDASALAFLDEVHSLLANSKSEMATDDAIRQLYAVLRERKRLSGEANWKRFVRLARQHPLCDVLHEDPFTWRAFSKPRGYPGDAVLMDYIYGREEARPRPRASEIGGRLFDCNTVSSACRGVMARRGFAADLIDDLCRENQDAAILSVASGHLREAGLSAAVRRRALQRFVAIDSDEESLAEVERSYHRTPIECVHASARRIITGRLDVGSFDLIYSLGLYDYLKEPTATRLTERLFSMLNPGGILLIANFLPDIECVGYMETFMDWNLIYRDRFDMMTLTSGIDEHQLARFSTFTEEAVNVVFGMLHRI